MHRSKIHHSSMAEPVRRNGVPQSLSSTILYDPTHHGFAHRAARAWKATADRELRYQLPARSVELFRHYESVFGIGKIDRFLFPSPCGGRRQTAAFSEMISHQILRHIGVHITPRALRFLGVTIYLIQHPGRHETVRQAMGHKTLTHTRRMFRFVRAVQSARDFDALITATSN